MSEAFEQRPDSGRLMATQSKRTEKSPDYWGEIAINVKDLTKVQVLDGMYIFKINGWKKKSRTGTTYLSLAIDRYIPKEETQSSRPQDDDDDSDVPF